MKKSDSEFTFVYKQVERDLANHLKVVILNGYGQQKHITNGVDKIQREVYNGLIKTYSTQLLN